MNQLKPTPSPSFMNQRLARKLLRDITAVSLSPTITLIDHAQQSHYHGQGQVTAVWQAFFVNGLHSPNMEMSTLLADNTTATFSINISGKQQHPFWGLPNTGRHISLKMAVICRFETGVFTQIELYYDAGSLLRQLGLAF
ncbi:MAG: hypothetical protein GY943_19245 [Chloroflexi bacterium]|nr:hypothetical protein [Chloroflexota bacterium]